MPKQILIAAHARSGSTFLCRLLKEMPEFQVYLEIFHFHLSVIQQHLHGDYETLKDQLGLSNDESSARTEIVCRCRDYLQLLSDMYPEKHLVFKIFPKHLPHHRLKEVISGSDVIIILRRNLLHSYISNVISHQTNKWEQFDTSNHKITFNERDFMNHVRSVVSFNHEVLQIARGIGKNPHIIDYESIANSEFPPSFINRYMSEILAESLTCGSGFLIKRKQDRRALATEKVKNKDALEAFLHNANLVELDFGEKNCRDSDYQNIITA